MKLILRPWPWPWPILMFVIALYPGAALRAEGVDALSAPALALADRSRSVTLWRVGSGRDLLLAPRPAVRERMRAELASFGNGALVGELLGRVRTPASLSRLKKEERNLLYYNILRSVSSLKGVRTVDASGREGSVIFEDSYVVAYRGARDRRPDRLVSSIPERDILFAVQKDSLFGTNDMVLDYRRGADGLSLGMRNDSPIKLGPIQVIEREGLSILAILMEQGDSVWLYAVGMARVASFPGIDQIAENAVRERIDALFNWFVKRIDAVAAS